MNIDIRAFACGLYTLLCGLLQWASDSGIVSPFVHLFGNIWEALSQFCRELYDSRMGGYISSMGSYICKPFIDIFMKVFNFVKCLGSLFFDICNTVIVKAAPNMCFGVSLLVFILDTNTYNPRCWEFTKCQEREFGCKGSTSGQEQTANVRSLLRTWI